MLGETEAAQETLTQQSQKAEEPAPVESGTDLIARREAELDGLNSSVMPQVSEQIEPNDQIETVVADEKEPEAAKEQAPPQSE